MSKQDIIKEYTLLGELVAQESELGEKLIQLTIAQKKAHNNTRLQADKCRNLEIQCAVCGELFPQKEADKLLLAGLNQK